jgi:Na+/melibiose symporter-like transporter
VGLFAGGDRGAIAGTLSREIDPWRRTAVENVGEPLRARSSYGRLLRNRNYVRVFSAGLGSIAGSTIASICLVWIVYVATGSALFVGLLGTANLAGALLFSVFGGTLVDRYDRRRLMILADVVRGVAMGIVSLVLALRGFDLAAILGANFLIGAFTTIFNPAEQALVPSLVGTESIADANGLVRSSRSSLQFVGASIGGVLIVTVGPIAGVFANALTFFLSAALLTGMRIPSAKTHAGTPIETRAEYFADLKAGFAWLYRATGFFQLTISATFFNFCANVVATFLVFYATEVLHGSALVFALLLAVEVLGTGIGALLVGPLRAATYAGKAWTIPYGIVSGAAVLLLVAVPAVPVALAVLFAIGLLAGFAGTAWLTAAQILVPTEMQGRYYGIDNLGSVAILPVAQIGGAFLIEAVGLRSTYFLVAVLWMIAGVAFLFPRALMRLGVPSGATSRSAGDASGTTGSHEGTRDG